MAFFEEKLLPRKMCLADLPLSIQQAIEAEVVTVTADAKTVIEADVESVAPAQFAATADDAQAPTVAPTEIAATGLEASKPMPSAASAAADRMEAVKQRVRNREKRAHGGP